MSTHKDWDNPTCPKKIAQCNSIEVCTTVALSGDFVNKYKNLFRQQINIVAKFADCNICVIIKQNLDRSLTIDHSRQKRRHSPTTINKHKVRINLLSTEHAPRFPSSKQKLCPTVVGEIRVGEVRVAPLLGRTNITMKRMKPLRKSFFRQEA